MSTAADLGFELEWIESPQEKKEAKQEQRRKRPKIRVSRITLCPTCEWHESESASECLRCGKPLDLDVANDPALSRLGITKPEAGVKNIEIDELDSSRILSPQEYLLRLEAERLDLVQGFEDLISLEMIDIRQFDYQLEACRKSLSTMRGRVLLADEVGLGKTVEAGLIMKELIARGMARRVLVLTPASLVYQWQEELESKFGESFEAITTPEQWEELSEADDARALLSLDRAKGDRHAPFVHARGWDLVIIDEAHRLKNRSTVAYKFVRDIERRYMLMLTATPVHNDLTELYSLIDLLKPGQLGTVRQFREQFVKSGDARTPENAPALQQLLSDVMIRNRRTKVGVEFPERKAAVIHVDLPPTERELYDEMTGFIRRAFQSGAVAKAQHLRLGLMTLQRELCSSPAALLSTLQTMSGDDKGYDPTIRKELKRFAKMADAIGYAAKVDALLSVMEDYPGKFLVFTEFRKSQDDLVRALDESGISCVSFHGGLRAKEKEAAVRAFKNDVRVMVSTESGGEGRNLQFCHQLVNYDLPWNPMRVEQRIGRLHRLGQENDVLVFNLSTKDTLEAYLLDLLVKKIKMFQLVVGELDLIIGDTDKPGGANSFEDMVRMAITHAEDEFDLQMSLEEIGSRFEQSRSRYLDRRVLNEEMFELLDDEEAEDDDEEEDDQ